MKKTLKEKNAILHPQKTPTGASAPSAGPRQLASAEMLPRRRGNFKTVKKWRPGALKILETNSMCQLKNSHFETSGRICRGNSWRVGPTNKNKS